MVPIVKTDRGYVVQVSETLLNALKFGAGILRDFNFTTLQSKDKMPPGSENKLHQENTELADFIKTVDDFKILLNKEYEE